MCSPPEGCDVIEKRKKKHSNPSSVCILKRRYGFGFERVLVALGEDALLDNRSHPSSGRYAHQRQLIVQIDAYAWVVPFVQEGNAVFLKTMFPSRKATKRYLGAKDE
jgi:hypothetical protein